MINKNWKNIILVSAFVIANDGFALADGLETSKPASEKNVDAKNKSSDDSDETRVKILKYDETNVYVIRTKYGYQTNIVFSPSEEIQTISVGDRSLWQLVPAGNRLFIRPMSEGITTNMTLITNKHSYEFDLKSVDKDNESNIYVAKFLYPSKENEENKAPSLPIEAKPEPVKLSSDLTINNTKKSPKKHDFNYNYTYAGADALAPSQVYDDGQSTFITYPVLIKPLPDIFIIAAGGQEFISTPTVKGNTLIINDIAGEIRLRSNGGEVKVYNEKLGH